MEFPTWTPKRRPLAAEVRYLVNGTAFVPTAQYDCDLDGDGDTDAGDAQIILNYVAGLLDQVDRKADLDGDGQITTYDAYCLLNALETGRMVLPAGSSVEVTAEILLTEDTKASLDRQYENGAYLEGYLFVEPVATSEGETAPVHSIPILGFYGNWSQPSMYDRLTYTDALYGDATVPYLGFVQTNNPACEAQRGCQGLFPGGQSLPAGGALSGGQGGHLQQ